jgi:aspartyl-tRNA synthetase
MSAGASSFAHITVRGSEIQSRLSKIVGDAAIRGLAESVQAEPGDLVLLLGMDSDRPERVRKLDEASGELRLEVARRLDLLKPGDWKFAWVVDFPMFEYDEREKRYAAMHHPFTSPREEDLDKLETDPGRVKARAYDLVLNGSEIGGGSIRIHRQDIQRRVFSVLGLKEEKARARFGFFLDALEYGTPPHGGIALGYDRIVALMAGESNIREVIAFPKTAKALDLMADAPTTVSDHQLKELHIRVALKS